MQKSIRRILNTVFLLLKKISFHLFFTRVPHDEQYCNSKQISVLLKPSQTGGARKYLAFVRCGTRHQLIDDDGERNFDIALNLYAKYNNESQNDHEYLIVGGLNKYKAAYQFIDGDLLARYKGVIFLDDDLVMSYSSLSRFLEYCSENNMMLAQPSLSRDSYCSHKHLVNVSGTGWRAVDIIEVMCPYFSAEALKVAIRSFDLSYSTWGLDYIWPKLLGVVPAVVDEYTIKHIRPINSGGDFYKYMRSIGVSPERELKKLRSISIDEI